MIKLCIEYGCVSVNYYLDTMQPYELYPILSNLHLKVKEDCERTRNIMYAVCQSQSTKHLKVTDIMTLPWDDTDNQLVRNVKKVELTKEYIEKMKNEAIKHKEEYQSQGLIEK